MTQLGTFSGPIITRKKDNGTFSQAKLVNLSHEFADHIVHTLNHLAIIHPAIFPRHIRHLLRDVISHIMSQCHGVIGKEGFFGLTTFLHESPEKIHVQVRPILALGIGAQATILIDHGLVKPRALMPTKDTPLIKPHARRLFGVLFHQAQLPLAGDGRGVACLFKHLSHGIFLFNFGKTAPAGFQSEWVFTGHQTNPSGMAHRHTETIIQTHTALGQHVDMRRLPALATIGSDGFTSHIISHDQHDVWL